MRAHHILLFPNDHSLDIRPYQYGWEECLLQAGLTQEQPNAATQTSSISPRLCKSYPGKDCLSGNNLRRRADDNTSGRKKMVRKPPLNRTFALRSKAIIKASAIPTGTVRMQKKTVFQVAFQNSAFPNIST